MIQYNQKEKRKEDKKMKGFRFEYWVSILGTYEVEIFKNYEKACEFCDKMEYDHEEIMVMVF